MPPADGRNGAVALVTGARRGIGAAVAVALARPGWTVLVHHLAAPDEAAAVVARCRDRGASSSALEADLCDAEAIAALCEQADARTGGIDVLVNNAARPSPAALGKLTLAEWHEVVAVNLTAALLLSQHCAVHMADAGWGRIINVTSATVRQGGPSGVAYVTTKAGLVGMTRSLARQLGHDGITVNAVSPGAVMTEGEAEVFAAEPAADLHARILARQAVPRRVVAADVAGLVAHLASPAAGALTGQVIEVNAGTVLR